MPGPTRASILFYFACLCFMADHFSKVSSLKTAVLLDHFAISLWCYRFESIIFLVSAIYILRCFLTPEPTNAVGEGVYGIGRILRRRRHRPRNTLCVRITKFAPDVDLDERCYTPNLTSLATSVRSLVTIL